MSEVMGIMGIQMIIAVVFFVFILPRLMKMREKLKKEKAEEKIRKEQVKTTMEKEKLEREILRKKMMHEADLDIKNKQPKFCQYCGGKIPAGSFECDSCGAKLQQK